MESSGKLIGIEIGGTNIKVIITNTEAKLDTIIKDISNYMHNEFKTKENTNETICELCLWIKSQIDTINIEKVCVSMFGPLSLKKENYGQVLNTPKPGWKNFNVVNALSSELSIQKEKIIIELDVNCAAFLEYKYNNTESIAYITIGTGVGVGIVINKTLIHGLQHPEGGHIRVSKKHSDDFQGVCSIHKDCLEGLVTNKAIKDRKGLISVDDICNLTDNDNVWNIISDYIAQLCLNLLYLYSIEKIVIGGGIINRKGLLEKIHDEFIKLNNNYIDLEILKKEHISNYIIRTEFNNNAGIISAIALYYQ